MKKYIGQSLPVLTHHSVSEDKTRVSVRAAVFEEQCRQLAEAGWFGIGLDEAEEFLLNGVPLPKKSFLMTFDDGFLDNYMLAWPVMRKYGHKGVIFVVTDKISQAQEGCAAQGTIRPTLDDVWQGRCAREDLPDEGRPFVTDAFGHTTRRDLFFTWDEARLMEQSKVISIAAHSTRHERVFAGPAHSGFLRPGTILNPFPHTVPPSFWGMPNFEPVPELANRAFIPSRALVEAVTALVPQDTAAAFEFLQSPDNEARLKALVEKHAGSLGEFESREEQAERLGAVMQRCQAALTRELGHRVRSFCWPWGVFCEDAREQGLRAGFEIFYTTRLGVNLPGSQLSVGRVKVKNRTDSWLPRRLQVYSRAWLAFLYLKMRL